MTTPPPDFARVFAALPDPCLLLRADAPRFTIVAASDAWLAAVGGTREGLVGGSLFEHLAPGCDAGALHFSLAHVLRDRCAVPVSALAPGMARDGGWRIVNAPVPDATGAVGFVVHRLLPLGEDGAVSRTTGWSRESAADAFAILDQMPIGVIVAEAPSGAIFYNNPEAVRLLGFGAIEARGIESYGKFGALHEDGRPFAPGDYSTARAIRGETIYRRRERYRRGDGRLTTFEVNATPVRDAEGRIRLALVTAQDIAARLDAEEALRQAQKMEAVGRLTGGIAHDFNNLLTAVIGHLDMIVRRAKDDPATTRHAQRALAAVERGSKLTGQLLTFARTQQLELKPVDVDRLLHGMDALLERSLGPLVTLEIRADSGGATARADANQLELALLNLAINARDAMPDGGRLTLATRRLDDHRIEITVADTGVGMTDGVAARAFEPFFTTKEVGKGSGLGLAQVYGLARQCGGDARIDSAPGQGTTVRITLPVADGQAGAPAVGAAAVPAPRAGDGARRPLLLVDDDPAVRELLVEALETEGYAVLAAADGPAALARLADHQRAVAAGGAAPLGAAIIDYAMPGMNGVELARAVRDLLPQLPILFASGYADNAALETITGSLLLRKPLHLDRLAAALRDALEPGGPPHRYKT